MPTPVVMPQMGESIAEGTIVRWIKKIGEAVDRDEPLFEISTDKVDAEIPSPAAGVLTEIKVQEGETVAVNAVVATIGQAGETVVAAPTPDGDSPASAPKKGAEQAAASAQPQPDGAPSAAPAPASATADRVGSPRAADAPAHGRANGSGAAAPEKDELRRQKSSPLVRRIAREHNVDIGQLHGSGIGGRVTKHDILDFLEHQPAEEQQARPAPAYQHGERVEVKPLSVMRRKIAEHMVLSRRTSAHVHSVFHVNFSAVEKIRQQKKADYEQAGTKLTYMAFIAKAVVDALRRHPVVNASLDGTNIVYKKDINLGIAVALESGLIVPVIRNADEKNILGLSRAIADVADRARAKQLKPEEVHDGTFTITNPGQFGSQFGLPIINQPQLAILGVGTIEKRPIVIDDAIAIRTMAYLTLGYDHRVIDGAVGDAFMADIKQQIEHFDPNQV
jgi:2-oxoglutarate dehydrogenase E2 component (dihydrolipoamide succinyltransferase)